MQETNSQVESRNQSTRLSCYNFFELLRFIAAILIACFLHFHDHFIPLLKIPNPFEPYRLLWMFSTQSYVFVELFFIISGILFIHAYYPKIGKAVKEYYSFDRFLIHRIIRIYPVAILTATVMYLTECILYLTHNPLWRGNVDLVALMMNYLWGGSSILQVPHAVNGPAWYLSVLMGCYVIEYPLSLLHKKTSVYFLWLIPICFGLIFVYNNYHIAFISHDWGRGLVAFFEGCIFEFMRQKFTLSKNARKRLMVICFIVLLASFMYMYKHSHGYKFIGNLKLYYDFYIFPALLFLLMHCDWVNKICDCKLIRELGNISYGIYLWNFPICAGSFAAIKLTKTAPGWISNHWQIVWLGLFISHIIIGILSYYLFEKPISVKLKSYLQ